MKVFVADVAPDEEGEFAYAIPGELCMLAPACDAQEYHPVEVCSCGCTVAWMGLTSKAGTTCVRVAELDTSPELLTDILAGLVDGQDDADAIFARLAAEATVRWMTRLTAPFPVGTPLWRDGDMIGAREPV